MNRPKHFNDIIGHDWLVKYFTDHVQKGTLHQFLILHGPEGTGKTSIADLIALDLVYLKLRILLSCHRITCFSMNVEKI